MNRSSLMRATVVCAYVFTLGVALAPASASAAYFDPFYDTSFEPPDTLADWAIAAGSWQLADGEFVSSQGALSLATLPRYEPFEYQHDTIGSDFSLEVYAALSSTAANARIGIVFDYINPSNFHEVMLSGTGEVQLRSTLGGASRTLAAESIAPPGAQKWVRLTLVRSNGRSTVHIDGVAVFTNVLQDGLALGDVGLIARNTRARFDDLDVRGFGRQDPYIEDFNDQAANEWLPLNGTWSATSSSYTNSAVIATGITQTPLHAMWEPTTSAFDTPYTFKVRILNPYGASGNLAGVAWVRDAANYVEAVFSPTGQARLNSVSNGARSTIASATYLGGNRNRWFEVEIAYDGVEPDAVGRIKVNGVPVFDVAPSLREGVLSLITHWAPARFDDVRASPRIFRPLQESFDGTEPPRWIRSATWASAEGMFTNSAIDRAARAIVEESTGWHELQDIEFRARMLNRFGSSGNLVGFTYGARASVYYEAAFSPTGVAHLRKVVKGVPMTIATAPYEGGERSQWFDAQLIQIDGRTTVKVNGATVFDNVLQLDAVGGALGFVAHWTNASVDDVSITQIPVTRYRLTELPDIVEQFETLTSIRALNDRGEAVGLSRNFDAKPMAVLWRSGSVVDLGATGFNGSVAEGINNRSEIVGTSFGTMSSSFYWQAGQLRDLLPNTEAHDINEAGQIVGWSCGQRNGCPAMLWERNGSFTSLEDVPGGIASSGALAINDRGDIVGFGFGDTNRMQAIWWQDRMVEGLGIEGNAADVNNRGQIVGLGFLDRQRAVMWQTRELVALPSRPGETSAQASAINEHGVIVGSSEGPSSDPFRRVRPTLWQEGRVVDLNELIACDTLSPSRYLMSAMDINERGEIAVDAFDFGNTHSRAFVLRPVSGREECDP